MAEPPWRPEPQGPPSERARRTCARKERFTRWDMAEKAAKRVRRRDRDPEQIVEPFQCPCCGGIHVGSRPKHPERIDRMLDAFLASFEED